ncbi:MAG: putative manganese-dependent inorganic diphosphatase [Nitrospinota bacterium]
MDRKTIVIGHKNPDTDSICSALTYAHLKSEQGLKNVLAARAGNVNPQTDFVLQYFNFPPPVFISDLYPRVSDVMIKNPSVVSAGTPILEVMKTFNEKKIRFVPVVRDEKVSGTLITLNLAERFSSYVEPLAARKVFTSIANVARATDSRVLTPSKTDVGREFNVFVGAMSEESFTKTISGYDPSELIIVVGDRSGIINGSIKHGVGLIIVTGGLKVSADIVKSAKRAGVPLIVTPHDSATAAWLVRLSVPAESLCSKEFSVLAPNDLAEQARKKLVDNHERGVIVVDEKGRLRGLVTKSCLLDFQGIRLILMDHNELSQAVDGAEDAEIVEVVDHHRIAGIKTALPINFVIEPVGSTCTLVAEKFRETGVSLSKNMAGLLAAGIISDTVSGRSPTTTSKDFAVLERLLSISGINKDKFAFEMFNASSILDKKPPRGIIFNDFKEFDIGGKKVGVGQVEVVGFQLFEKVKGVLIEELQNLRKEQQYDLISLMVTDITYEVTLLVLDGDPDLCDLLALSKKEENVFEMKGVLSRKKQVIPHFVSVFGK